MLFQKCAIAFSYIQNIKQVHLHKVFWSWQEGFCLNVLEECFSEVP